MLKGHNWGGLLEEAKHILEPFSLQTMRMQDWGSGGGNGWPREVMASMRHLLEYLEDRKLFYRAVPEVGTRYTLLVPKAPLRDGGA